MKKQSQFKPNFRKAKMDVNLYVIEDYENETAFRVQVNKAKQTQFQSPTNPPKEREEEKGGRVKTLSEKASIL